MLVNKRVFIHDVNPKFVCSECGSNKMYYHISVDEDDWNGGGWKGILNKTSCHACGNEEKDN